MEEPNTIEGLGTGERYVEQGPRWAGVQIDLTGATLSGTDTIDLPPDGLYRLDAISGVTTAVRVYVKWNVANAKDALVGTRLLRLETLVGPYGSVKLAVPQVFLGGRKIVVTAERQAGGTAGYVDLTFHFTLLDKA